jgi:hypothetical protein
MWDTHLAGRDSVIGRVADRDLSLPPRAIGLDGLQEKPRPGQQPIYTIHAQPQD